MFNMINNQNETIDRAIEIAIRNGEMQAEEYDVIPSANVPGVFYVQHKVQVERCYIVNTNAGRERCQCKQWEKAGTCKHQIMVADYRQCEEADEKAANLYL